MVPKHGSRASVNCKMLLSDNMMLINKSFHVKAMEAIFRERNMTFSLILNFYTSSMFTFQFIRSVLCVSASSLWSKLGPDFSACTMLTIFHSSATAGRSSLNHL